MDMKLKPLIDNGATLHELDINRWVVHDILKDLSHQYKSVLARSFEIYFFKFVDAFLPLYGSLTTDQRERLKVIFMATSMVKHTPDEFVQGFILKDFKQPKRYEALFQSAFIYAAAGTYGSQIKRIYMRATNVPKPPTEQEKLKLLLAASVGTDTIDGKYLHGTIEDAAQHSDAEYLAYMDKTHPLLSSFVRSKNRFKYKQVLAVMCYLTNPKLEKE